MIYGIGVDLVDVTRIEKVVKRWGSRFVDRVFTDLEKQTSYKRVHPYSALALRFAAKEAFSKALGLGMKEGVKWKEIEVFNDEKGKPEEPKTIEGMPASSSTPYRMSRVKRLSGAYSAR